MQKTVKKSISFLGPGIHTGVITNMTLKPAKEETGIRFVRVDLEGNPEIKADIDNLFATERSTSLRQGDAEIHSVENIYEESAISLHIYAKPFDKCGSITNFILSSLLSFISGHNSSILFLMACAASAPLLSSYSPSINIISSNYSKLLN